MAPPVLAGEVRRELRRGAMFGVTLSARSRSLLEEVVAAGGEDVAELGAARGLGSWVRRRRARTVITRLTTLGYVRHDGGRLVPTVAGVGVVRPALGFTAQHETLLVLCAMRAAETR